MRGAREADRILRRLRRRVMLAIGRGVLRTVDDAAKTQLLQVEGLQDELLEDVEHLLPYGLTAHPKPGALILLLAMGGMRQHSVAAAAVDPDARPRGLSVGEVCLYSHLDGGSGGPHRVHFLANGHIRLQAGRTTLELEDAGMTLTTPSGTQTWGTG